MRGPAKFWKTRRKARARISGPPRFLAASEIPSTVGPFFFPVFDKMPASRGRHRLKSGLRAETPPHLSNRFYTVERRRYHFAFFERTENLTHE